MTDSAIQFFRGRNAGICDGCKKYDKLSDDGKLNGLEFGMFDFCDRCRKKKRLTYLNTIEAWRKNHDEGRKNKI